jgi:molybdopterin-guanine dinucleotide biosynthesis protein A
MGKEKAGLYWRGGPLLDHIVTMFAGCDDLFLSVRDRDQKLPLPLPQVPDALPNGGPLAGLAASLDACRHDLLFVTTCDAPYVKRELADLLVSQMRPEDQAVVVRTRDGRIHPLIALYAKEVLPMVRASLERGERRMVEFLSTIPVRYLSALEYAIPEQWFTNLNTPQEYQRIEAVESKTREQP